MVKYIHLAAAILFLVASILNPYLVPRIMFLCCALLQFILFYLQLTDNKNGQ